MNPPTIQSKVEPEYSAEARAAKLEGSVVMSAVIDENGLAQQIKVSRSLGMGLDEKAIEAVQEWRFRPAAKDGKLLAVYATIEVRFRLS